MAFLQADGAAHLLGRWQEPCHCPWLRNRPLYGRLAFRLHEDIPILRRPRITNPEATGVLDVELGIPLKGNQMGQLSKVFGIGLSKTGTTSLTAALNMLNIPAKHQPLKWSDFQKYQALCDSSVALRFHELDERFPGSKFIYTIRAHSSWLDSCRRHFATRTTQLELKKIRRLLYGCDQFDEDLFSAAYRWHDLKVRRHFRSRPAELLILDICEDESPWDHLCPFLNCDRPNVPFPWENRKSHPLDANHRPP